MFERERTLPCRDLVNRIELSSPSRIVDLGCGPGNSTAVLAQKWPNAEILGVDSSIEMLKQARASRIKAEWILEDIQRWNSERGFDLVFSNAALQWIADHEREIPRLFNSVANGGALAFQIPTRTDLWNEVLEKLVTNPSWANRFRPVTSNDFFSHKLEFYYSVLSNLSKQIDLWETKYIHILPTPEAVVEWTKGTALRPLLDRLKDANMRNEFLAEYTREITKAFPSQDGKILFPFLRRFVVAYR